MRPAHTREVYLLILADLAPAGLILLLWADFRGDGEAWNHGAYSSFVLPAMATFGAVAGFSRPPIALLSGVATILPQAIALFAAAALTVVALLAARLRQWLGYPRVN